MQCIQFKELHAFRQTGETPYHVSARMQTASALNDHRENRMQTHHPQRSAELRAVIVEFLNKRLADKLDGIKGDNPEDEPQRQQRRTELHQQFQPATWLDDAARRASQIQAVTH
jgi:hypothetical protein